MDSPIRAQILIIAALLSSIAWVASFQSARHLYRLAEQVGMPNLHIWENIRDISDV